MLELIRASSLNYHQMTTASKGALHVPPAEMLEILVYLAEHNKIFGNQAQLTLAAWDENSAKVVAANPAAPKEVLEYWLSEKNLRPALFPLLLENPSVSISKISQLAINLKGEWIDVLLTASRVRNSPQLLQDLSTNHQLSGAQAARVQALIGGESIAAEPAGCMAVEVTATATEVVVEPTSAPEAAKPSSPPSPVPPLTQNEAAAGEEDEALLAFFAEHAAEIAAEADKPFQPIGGIIDELREEPKAAAAAASSAPVPSAPVVQAKPGAHKTFVNPEDEKRGSVLQKINKLDVKGRIQLAMKGTKEERSILVRDGTKIVALAVLDSPKISDGEVEKFATQKNVLEAVLRAIPMKRRYAKNYAVIRNLVFNPRTPLDVALGLMKNLLVADLKNLSGNKEVPDTVRKLALRMFKQKVESAKKD
jgi:hypothetical protein